MEGGTTRYRGSAEHAAAIAALDVGACMQWPRYDAVCGTVAFPSYRDFCACNSLNTADVDAAVFTSGVSAMSERHDCPVRSTSSDDRAVSADTGIAIDSSVSNACRGTADGPQEHTYQAVRSQPAESSLAETRELQTARGMVLFTELHDKVGFAAVWRGVWEPLRERSFFAEVTRSSIENACWGPLCLRRGRQQNKTTGGGHDAVNTSRVTGVDSVVARIRNRDIECPAHNSLSRLIALIPLCFGGALNAATTELEMNRAPCPRFRVNEIYGSWMQILSFTLIGLARTCFDPGGNTDTFAIRLLPVRQACGCYTAEAGYAAEGDSVVSQLLVFVVIHGTFSMALAFWFGL